MNMQPDMRNKSGPTSIIVRRRDRSLTIIFNRPEIRSPISTGVIDEIEAALLSEGMFIDTDELVFTGRDGVFASGADLREIASLTAGDAADFARRGQQLMRSISTLPVPTKAVIDGYCFGGALDLALACGRRLATRRSLFCHPGSGLGIITGWGGTQRLPRLVGETNALYMLLTAEPVTATDALRIGLIDEIVPDQPDYAISS